MLGVRGSHSQSRQAWCAMGSSPWTLGDFRHYLYLLGSVSHLSFSGSESENAGFLKAVFYVLLLFSLQRIEQSLEHSRCSSIC